MKDRNSLSWKIEFLWKNGFWPQEQHIRTCEYFDRIEKESRERSKRIHEIIKGLKEKEK